MLTEQPETTLALKFRAVLLGLVLALAMLRAIAAAVISAFFITSSCSQERPLWHSPATLS
ncbi:hypothetical protein [Deinococcus arcticus]|uniref:hypothetical protein n=1 Tax=Deinococcus arcticus TaxID=2136176 RepID=UPI001304A6D7|nr:hypothetical protein [Deinococcus arcticus]